MIAQNLLTYFEDMGAIRYGIVFVKSPFFQPMDLHHNRGTFIFNSVLTHGRLRVHIRLNLNTPVMTRFH